METQRLVRDRLMEYILEKDLKAGDLLPREIELMAQLDVGRHPLREAMRALQAIGIVEIRHGYGTFVGGNGMRPLEECLDFRIAQSRSAGGQELANVLRTWRALELGFSEELVECFKKSSNDDPEGGQEQSVSTLSLVGKSLSDATCSSHLDLYAQLGNSMLIEILDALRQTFFRATLALPAVVQSSAGAAQAHRDLIECLGTGDVRAFRRSLKAHFEDIESSIFVKGGR